MDNVALISRGVYTETYGASELQTICNLYASYGMIIDAPVVVLMFEYVYGTSLITTERDLDSLISTEASGRSYITTSVEFDSYIGVE